MMLKIVRTQLLDIDPTRLLGIIVIDQIVFTKLSAYRSALIVEQKAVSRSIKGIIVKEVFLEMHTLVNLDLTSGFLSDFSFQRHFHAFTDFNTATWERIFAIMTAPD